MSGPSPIEWTGSTWSPNRGCSRTSPGCERCYAEKIAARFCGPGLAFEGFAENGKWTRKVSLMADQLDTPLHWKKPRTIFVNSMSDTFHEGLSNENVAGVFGVMSACPQHTFQVLTKRAERLPEWFDWISSRKDAEGEALPPSILCEEQACSYGVHHTKHWLHDVERPWPLPNVHLGVSIEDRKHGLPRLEHLRKVPAALRFLSIEPLLEDLGEIDLTGIGWVIVGGESGAGARPFNIAWVRSIVRQCRTAGVPVFVKQFGANVVWNGVTGFGAQEWPPWTNWEQVDLGPGLGLGWRVRLKDKKGGDMAEWPEDLRVREMPKETA